MSGSGWLQARKAIVAMIAAAGFCLVAAPITLSTVSGSASSEPRIESVAAPELAAPAAQSQELVWANEPVPPAESGAGGMAISLLAALSILFVAAAIVMRNAQSPRRREGPGADVKRALSLIASHWPQQIEASHLAMMRG
ncbi:MAG TPA: hypothetical protein VF662_07630 [Allosphingosinicella sp.]|jgi:hypothetical protein